jgi:nucleoside-diphosphate-sugar epimerase
MDAGEAPGKVYNVACGERISLNRLVGELRDLMDTDVEPVYAAPRAGDIKHSLADLSSTRAELGYEPAISLRDGLERTLEHFKQEDVDGQLMGVYDR